MGNVALATVRFINACQLTRFKGDSSKDEIAQRK